MASDLRLSIFQCWKQIDGNFSNEIEAILGDWLISSREGSFISR